jgi:enoyl-CoA hydratase
METLTTEIHDNIGIITLNRPKALNAINTEMVEELDAVLEQWEQREQRLTAIIITGAGKAFAAGADISQMTNFSPEEAAFFAQKGQATLRRLEESKYPTIAAVNGFALGGGCELAMCCDIILAAPKALFGQPEVKLGVLPGFGGTQRLVRRVGRQRALELMMTGRNVKADEAVSLGIALEKVSDEVSVLDAALTLANKISTNGPVAVELVKKVVDETDRMDIDMGLAVEAASFGLCFATTDQKEGMSAFLSKRPANFEGK